MDIEKMDEMIFKLHIEGKSVKDISETTNLSKSKIYNVIKAYKNNTVINYKKRGRKFGEKRRIPETLYDTIIRQKPNNGVWTVNSIKAKLYSDDIVVSVNTIKNFLKRYEIYKTVPNTSKVISNTQKNSKETLYVSLEYHSYNNIDDTILCYAYDSHKIYYFLFYTPNDDIRAVFGNEAVNRKTVLLFDFIKRCLTVKKKENIIVCITSNCSIQTIKKDDWMILNKHYKKNISMPKIEGKNESYEY